MREKVVITGIGMVTPLGCSVPEVLTAIALGQCKAVRPDFDTTPFDCEWCASIDGFDAEEYFPENKTLRLMNRDAQLAAVAAHLAIGDSGVTVDKTYNSNEVGLYGSTGMAGMAMADVTKLIQYSADKCGNLDLKRFGQVTLKRVRPVLSFKLLANMPICFISILENLRGENAVFTPWEGHGAQALICAFHAVASGRAPCVVVGGCDVRNHLFSFINLQQTGVFASCRRSGAGCIPGEGACFLVLESEAGARNRGAEVYARLANYSMRSFRRDSDLISGYGEILSKFDGRMCNSAIVAAGDGEQEGCDAERVALEKAGYTPEAVIYPKSHLGDLFAGAAAVQVGLAAALLACREDCDTVLANCLGFGSEKAAFALEKP